MYRSENIFNSVKVNENLYAYLWQGMGNNCNSCLFVNVLDGDRPHVLIDPGHINNEFREDCFAGLVKTIEKDGFRIDDVGMIINTHSHTDHCEANQMFQGDKAPPIAMSEEEEKFRQTLGKRLDAMFGLESPKFETKIFLKEGKFKLGNKIELELYLSPGHSPGSICLYWTDKKILITGDVVFFGSIGRTDFPGGDAGELKTSIQRLSKLDVEYLIPGHSTELGNIISDKNTIERNFQTVLFYF